MTDVICEDIEGDNEGEEGERIRKGKGGLGRGKEGEGGISFESRDPQLWGYLLHRYYLYYYLNDW